MEKIRKGKIRLGGDNVVVMGFPDFTGTLREGEIFLCVDGRHQQPLALDESCCGGGPGESDGGGNGTGAWSDALVYHPPGVRASDVRRVRSVYCQALVDELFGPNGKIDTGRGSAVFFSVQGATPLADMLAGGDYDGDRFFVLQDRELLKLCTGVMRGSTGSGIGGGGGGSLSCQCNSGTVAATSASGGAPVANCAPLGTLEADAAAAATEAELQRMFLACRHETSALVGRAEVNHSAAADKFGLDHPYSRELDEIYLHALDRKGDVKRQAERVRVLQGKIGPRPTWLHYHRGGDGARYVRRTHSLYGHAACDESPIASDETNSHLCARGCFRYQVHVGGQRLNSRTSAQLRLGDHAADLGRRYGRRKTAP